MRDHPQGRAPDYTNAALVTGGVNLFWMLCLFSAYFGFPATLLAAWGLMALIDRLGRQRP